LAAVAITKFTDQKSDNPFPLFTDESYEFVGPGWPVGLNSTYPREFVRRIFAAGISYQLALSSIDYTAKRYLEAFRYEEQRDRLDHRMDKLIDSAASNVDAYLKSIANRPGGASLGVMLSETALARVPFSLRMAKRCAHSGALFETIAICRTIVEQLAWCLEVRRFDYAQEEEITKLNAQSCVGRLRENKIHGGRLYGVMSKHAHWAYPEHNKLLYQEAGTFTCVLGSSELKAEALCVVALTLLLFLDVTCNAEGAPSNRSRDDALQSSKTAPKLVQECLDHYPDSDLISELMKLTGMV
jgi:hypothetical protein